MVSSEAEVFSMIRSTGAAIEAVDATEGLVCRLAVPNHRNKTVENTRIPRRNLANNRDRLHLALIGEALCLRIRWNTDGCRSGREADEKSDEACRDVNRDGPSIIFFGIGGLVSKLTFTLAELIEKTDALRPHTSKRHANGAENRLMMMDAPLMIKMHEDRQKAKSSTQQKVAATWKGAKKEMTDDATTMGVQKALSLLQNNGRCFVALRSPAHIFSS